MSSSNSKPDTIIVDELVVDPLMHATKARSEDIPGIETVPYLDMEPYSASSIAKMTNQIDQVLESGSFSHPGGSVPQGVNVMEYLREQCRAIDAIAQGRGGSGPVAFDLEALEANFNDHPRGSGAYGVPGALGRGKALMGDIHGGRREYKAERPKAILSGLMARLLGRRNNG